MKIILHRKIPHKVEINLLLNLFYLLPYVYKRKWYNNPFNHVSPENIKGVIIRFYILCIEVVFWIKTRKK